MFLSSEENARNRKTLMITSLRYNETASLPFVMNAAAPDRTPPRRISDKKI